MTAAEASGARPRALRRGNVHLPSARSRAKRGAPCRVSDRRRSPSRGRLTLGRTPRVCPPMSVICRAPVAPSVPMLPAGGAGDQLVGETATVLERRANAPRALTSIRTRGWSTRAMCNARQRRGGVKRRPAGVMRLVDVDGVAVRLRSGDGVLGAASCACRATTCRGEGQCTRSRKVRESAGRPDEWAWSHRRVIGGAA
jgi:hypothetical protein